TLVSDSLIESKSFMEPLQSEGVFAEEPLDLACDAQRVSDNLRRNDVAQGKPALEPDQRLRRPKPQGATESDHDPQRQLAVTAAERHGHCFSDVRLFLVQPLEPYVL